MGNGRAAPTRMDCSSRAGELQGWAVEDRDWTYQVVVKGKLVVMSVRMENNGVDIQIRMRRWDVRVDMDSIIEWLRAISDSLLLRSPLHR